VIDWGFEIETPVRPLGVVPEQMIHYFCVEQGWIFKENFVLINELFLNGPVVFLNVAVHGWMRLKIPVVGHLLGAKVAREIFAKLRSVVCLHLFDSEWECHLETLKEVAGIR